VLITCRTGPVRLGWNLLRLAEIPQTFLTHDLNPAAQLKILSGHPVPVPPNFRRALWLAAVIPLSQPPPLRHPILLPDLSLSLPSTQRDHCYGEGPRQ
jgi:hypothetical protein